MTITAQQVQQWESETSAMRARITTAENKAYHFQQENERLRAAMTEIHMIARHPVSKGEEIILAICEANDEQDVSK